MAIVPFEDVPPDGAPLQSSQSVTMSQTSSQVRREEATELVHNMVQERQVILNVLTACQPTVQTGATEVLVLNASF